ncbi:DNA repair protein rad5 [Symbiodinium microadriaticum]|uniref:DNA repair protein rad5 n=1 Tax=Symbiodinium microadriaticum TaxID=2951 RepID=A0A1Q9DNJ4_SYMMI|nr:DNA repair protein rad5 [Symbiodinium microadriaticum]CAE7384450.1 mus-41 [Symbiodinium microadriaticum]
MDQSHVALAELLSLVEGSSISEEAAREALQASGQNVELAICRLFSGGPEQLGVIEIDESEPPPKPLSRGKRGPAPEGQQGQRAGKQRRQDPEPTERPAPGPETGAESGNGAGRSSSQETLPGAGDGSVEVSAIAEAQLPLEVQEELRRMGAGWSCSSQDTWTAFSPKISLEKWARQVLSQDPPCLSLQGQMDSSALKDCKSSGEMHSAAKAQVQAHYARQLEKDISTVKGGYVAVQDSLLESLFETLLAKVRYPPSDFGALSFSWRVRKLPAKSLPCVAPSALVGPVPARPFRLLNNANDASAEQPPHFLQHPLRPEQQRSLQWMLAQEADAEPFVVEWVRYWPTFGGGHLEVDEASCFVVGAAVQLSESASGPFLDSLGTQVPKDSLRGIGKITHDEGLGMRTSTSYKWVRFGETTVRCFVQELTFADSGALLPGCRVMLRPGLKAPAFGWGGVNPSMTGIFLGQEGSNVRVKWPTHENWKGKQGEVVRVDASSGQRPPMVLDLRLCAAYSVRGGILADKIGYGKTATSIALIDRQLRAPVPPVPSVDEGCFLPAQGTLIIVPSNLFEQWINEISKFVWDGRPLRQQMKSGWSPRECPLKIFAMSNVSPLSRCKASEVSSADVVICSYRLLYSQIYLKRREELCGSLWKLPGQVRGLLQGRVPLRSGRKGNEMVWKWEDLAFPVLEMFYWKRIIFDEFHELESFESTQQDSLQFLRSHFRWGLTGTPPIDTNAGAIFMSSLFRVDLPGYIETGGEIDLQSWEFDKLLTETAGNFLDVFVRQNTAELASIRLQEHVVIVRHTAAERALYLGQAHEAPDFQSMRAAAFQSQEAVSALERLLKLCSHFQVGGGSEVGSAHQECERIYDQKGRRVVRARNQMSRCCRVLALLQHLVPKSAKAKQAKAWQSALEKAKEALVGAGDAAKPFCEELDRELLAAEREDREQWLRCLDGHKPSSEELLQFLGPEGPKRGCLEEWKGMLEGPQIEARVLERLLLAQANEQAQNLRELHEAETSMDFFRRTVAALGGTKPEDRSCSVCLEENLPAQKMAITPCAHAFCINCLREAVEKFGRCSLCQRSLSLRDVQPLVAELEAAAAPPAASDERAATPMPHTAQGVPLDKYGTKLASLARKLSELRAEDCSAKVILFVQFDDLKRKVCSALTEFGIPCAMLQGGVGVRAGIIRDWQSNPQSRTFVLLLSLAQSASGTNLTAASHVIFLHPMLAPTAEKAVGYEMQAIGRARRHGQPRDTVHVWRFVTADTVEQTITEEHQGALWRCEQARQQEVPAQAPEVPGEA